MVRNQVRLACQAWYPETVVSICRKQREKSGCGLLRIADGHVQLVCGHEAVLKVPKLPPELVTDNRHLNRARWSRCILHLVNDACGGEEKHHNDQHRNHGPGKLYLIAAVNLRWFASVVVCPPPEFYGRVDQQASNDQKYDPRDRQPEEREPKDGISRCGGRGKNAR